MFFATFPARATFGKSCSVLGGFQIVPRRRCREKIDLKTRSDSTSPLNSVASGFLGSGQSLKSVTQSVFEVRPFINLTLILACDRGEESLLKIYKQSAPIISRLDFNWHLERLETFGVIKYQYHLHYVIYCRSQNKEAKRQ